MKKYRIKMADRYSETYLSFETREEAVEFVERSYAMRTKKPGCIEHWIEPNTRDGVVAFIRYKRQDYLRYDLEMQK